MTRLARRLPGISFEVKAPELTEVLPRMDIAAFVGLAASGPVNTPVAVEEVVSFAAIFGPDAPLAWDTRRGEMAYAFLGPAVRSFFDNGGRRAWIVRVAGPTAQANQFAIPGLLQAEFDENGLLAGFRPAFAPARSVGSWSDGFQVSSALLSQRLNLVSLNLTGRRVEAEIDASRTLVLTTGDMLRFSFGAENISLLLRLDRVKLAGNKRLQVSGSLQGWFAPLTGAANLDNLVSFQFQPEPAPVRSLVNLAPARLDPKTDQLILTVARPLAEAPALADLLGLDFGAGISGWCSVQAVRPSRKIGAIEIAGPAVRWMADGPAQFPSTLPGNVAVERLSFELWTRQSENDLARLSDLTFDAEHARFWGGLPSDEQLYDPDSTTTTNQYSDLWQEAANPRFGLAGSGGTNFFPLFMGGLPRDFSGPVSRTLTSLERNGLADFSSNLFLDPALAQTGAADLLTQADFLRYQGLYPRKLTGVHSLLAVEEITILAVPDAVQPGWADFVPPTAPSPARSARMAHPDWARCSDSVPPTGSTKANVLFGPDRSNFLDCGISIIRRPGNLHCATPDPTGTFRLDWNRVKLRGGRIVDAEYLLEEATRPDWSDTFTIYRGQISEYTLTGRKPGVYYYRVRAVLGEGTSEWSRGLKVEVNLENQWQMLPPQDFRPTVLLEVQQAALRMCAARGDMLAVLALPRHYAETAALEYLGKLRLDAGLAGSSGAFGILSYGAVYHPWLSFRYNGVFQTSPPDGMACGILARRAWQRGAWVAPANEPLPGVVALTPPIGESYRLELQEARLNLVRQEPRGFIVLNADTLSLDEDLRQINVRRLLILLRRMALKLGATYVFEPNDTALDRLVQGGFEAMLEKLFARGAFAGATPATAFQVVTTTLNSDRTRDQGRFIVEIRVAPALPLTFLTVRLVQADDRGTVTELI